MATPILNVDDIVVSEEDAVATFVLRLSQPATAATSLRFSILSSTTGGGDLDYFSGTVVFAAGETVRHVSVPLIDDNLVEQSESFFLQLSNPGGLVLGRTRANAVIVDNDDAVGPAPVPQASVRDVVLNENESNARFVIVLDHAATTSVTVSYHTVDGAAQAGSDYAAVTSSVTFAPGETAKTVLVPIVDDAVAEGEETFGIELTAATGGVGLADAQGVALIGRSDGTSIATPILGVDDIVVSEEDAVATFVLRLSQLATAATSVRFSIFSSTTGGSDLDYFSDTVVFAAGETVRYVNVPLIDDNLVEQPESFFLQLSNPGGLVLERTRANAVIIDNDDAAGSAPAPRASVGDAVLNENEGYARFAIVLDHAASTSVTVSYHTVDGTAQAGSDYAAVTSSVTFAPGETAKTVLVPIVDDAVAEGEETFGIELTAATGGVGLADAQGVALIGRSDGTAISTPILGVDDIVVSEEDAVATFVLRLSQPATAATSARFSIFSSTTGGSDLDYFSDTVVFAAGETVRYVNVPLIDDNLVEQPESFFLQLSNPGGLVLERTRANAVIIDNDDAAGSAPAPRASVGDAVLNENEGYARFAIVLDHAASTSVTVSYHTVDGTAQAGSDYAAVTSSVTFAPGETAKTVLVPIVDDAVAEGEETFGIELTAATGGVGLADAQGVALIGRSDGTAISTPILGVDDIVVSEEDAVATFVLRLSQPATAATSVRFSIFSSTTGGSDLDYFSDTVVFAAGETVRYVNVPLIDDNLVEQPESFFLQLSNPGGLVLERTRANAVIIDNDDAAGSAPAPRASVGDAVLNENEGYARFAIVLDHAASTSVTVSYHTVDGTAQAGSDYAAVTSSVTFAPGETAKTVLVPIVDDAVAEGEETFGIELTAATGGVGLADAQGVALIGRSDGTAISTPILGVDDIVVSEEDAVATFVLRLSQPATAVTSVRFSIFSSTTGGSDLDYFSDTVVFAAGETVRYVDVPLIDDNVVEQPESFFLDLSSPQGLVLGRTRAIGTIIDNDGPVVVEALHEMRAEGNSGGSAFTFAVLLNQVPSTNTLVSWSVAGFSINPASASDFAGGVLPSGSVTFLAGETRKIITVSVAGDTTLEGDETFMLSVVDPSGTLGIGTVQASGTILDDDALAVSIAATTVTAPEGDTGATLFTFTMNLNRAATTAQSVAWMIAGNGAHSADAADFAGGVLPSGAVTFAPGETSKSITVAVSGDALVEFDESFAVAISNVSSGLVVGSSVAPATILNDDVVRASISPLSTVKVEGQPGPTPLTFVMSLDRAATSVATLSWSVTGNGANPAGAVDFAGGTLPAGTVTFAVGETSKTITVNVAGDTVVEADEGFVVTLSNPTSGLAIGTASAGGTILNDDGVVSITAADGVKAEGNAGTTAFTFTVTHSGDTSVSHSVSYGVIGSGGNPAAPADLVGGALPSGTVSFAPGETSRTLTVTVAGDGAPEADESFTVTLSNPSSGLMLGTGSASAMGTILNDDTGISIAPAAAVRAEGNAGASQFTFTVTLTGDATSPRSVSYAVTGSGANPASAADFAGGVLPAGTVTFGVGETWRTITVDVAGDTVLESDEGFTVTLSNPSTGAALGVASAIGTILGDDATLSIAALSAVKAEGQAGTTAFIFTATRTGSLSVAHSASWAVTSSGANPAAASDFAGGVLPSGTVTFAAGETAKTITVNVAGDSTVEVDEGFLVTLSNPSSGLAIGSGTASGTIQNDDTAPPVAMHDDAYIVLQGQSLSIAASAGVLLNDPGASTASLLSGPSHGTLQLGATGGFGFTPAVGFSGIDSFTYRATNNGSTSADGQALLYVVPVQAGQATTLNLLALNAEEQIASTYAAFFGRGADAGGFGFWVGEFNRLLPTQGPAALFANIASSFGISAEAKALYPFLANPFGATDGQISAFLDSVYNNLFNRSSDAGGLAYWTGQIKQTLQAGQFVGSVLINIMSGAQDTAAGKDITTLMGKVAVSIAYVHEQQEHGTVWGAGDNAAATSLLDAVTADPASVLLGIKQADTLVAEHA